ncbi:hypothetical protein C2E21_2819 [Chlorella sorokiniana]|uniref:Uncharacterized protein n=1 Tax=Chlorella sorokiniana TaxID=3076 RepID=A0A2P6TWJ5_CHLSO|nr:hypothetical protein C2E21_2819 [Chlorella sorokiniana]|eukprot:PRW58438.1 hypothetical protein C2E21_2819 [Chlorella sorokiniana]
MSGRPQRQRHAPQRFGTFASAAQAEDLEAPSQSSEEEQEAAPRQRGKAPAAGRRRRVQESEDEEAEEESEGSEAEPPPRKRGRKQAAAAEEESEEGSDEDSSGEEEAAAAPPRQARRQPRFVPPPPKEPRSGSDMLGLLFACPALIDALLEPDGLRPVTLVARDAAHLAAALGASTADMSDLWCQLARRVDPRLAASGAAVALPQALEVVQRAVRADPARHQRLRTTDAEKEYRVTRGELKGLPFTTEYSYSFWASSIKMFSKLDVLAIAHRKWGTMAVLDEERAAAAAKSSRAKASREAQRDRREQQLVKALQKAGLAGPKSRSHSRNMRRRLKAFLKKGQGSVQELVQSAQREQEAEEGRLKRQHELFARLHEEGLDSERWGTAVQRYIGGQAGRQTLEQAVEAAKAAKQQVNDREARRTRITELFTQQGLAAFLPQQNAWGGQWGGYYGNYSRVSGHIDYVERGQGSEDAVLAAAQALQAREQARVAREARILELLAAEGLQPHYNFCYDYVQNGNGSEEEALAAARAAGERQAARAARQARITELLEAEGLQHLAFLCDAYVARGQGSEEEAMQRAREAAQAEAALQARREALEAALQAEGMALDGDVELAAAVYRFVDLGAGTLAEALVGAQAAHQAVQERAQRREQLTALMAAEGLSLVDWEWRLPGLRLYLQTGGGNKTAEEFVAQARAMSQPAPAGLQAYAV